MPSTAFRPALLLLLVLTVVLGFAYPAAITAIATVAFPDQAAGSLIVHDGKLVGSRLIGQQFSSARYFWGRLSATSPHPYDGGASVGTNFGPMNPALIDQVKSRIKALREADPENSLPVPVELVTASASGLDPEISPAAAAYQAPRVARARGLPLSQVQELIRRHQQGRTLGYLGEPRVNVLELNLALDDIH